MGKIIWCSIAWLLAACSHAGHSASHKWPSETAGKSVRQQAVQQSSTSYAATVVKISDGDTLHARDGDGRKHKVRLAYIDAPELQQAGGQDSRAALQDMLDGQVVQVVVFGRDRYQRELAQVVRGQEDAGLQQIKLGQAWHYVSYARRDQNPADFSAYAAAEQLARSGRQGLWRKRDAQAPWTFRQQQRQQQGGVSEQVIE